MYHIVPNFVLENFCNFHSYMIIILTKLFVRHVMNISIKCYINLPPECSYSLFEYFKSHSQFCSDCHSLHRASGIGPATLVLAGPVFSQGKSKIPFLQKANNKQSASVILGLIRLIILSYNR